jgi:hypothetical protein
MVDEVMRKSQERDATGKGAPALDPLQVQRVDTYQTTMSSRDLSERRPVPNGGYASRETPRRGLLPRSEPHLSSTLR